MGKRKWTPVTMDCCPGPGCKRHKSKKVPLCCRCSKEVGKVVRRCKKCRKRLNSRRAGESLCYRCTCISDKSMDEFVVVYSEWCCRDCGDSLTTNQRELDHRCGSCSRLHYSEHMPTFSGLNRWPSRPAWSDEDNPSWENLVRVMEDG